MKYIENPAAFYRLAGMNRMGWNDHDATRSDAPGFSVHCKIALPLNHVHHLLVGVGMRRQ